MQAIRRALDALSGLLLWLGGVAIVLMMVHIMVEVMLRTAFKLTIPGTEETVSAYYMIACAFLPLAWVQRSRAHVSVEVFTLWMPPRMLALLDGLVCLACAAGTAIFAWAATNKAIAMTRAGEILIGTMDVVVWPSRWFVPVGLVAMAIYMLLHAVADLHWAVYGGERRFGPSQGH